MPTDQLIMIENNIPTDASRLYSERFWPRHWIEDANTTSENLVDYLSTQCEFECFKDPAYMRLDDSGRQLRAQARWLEAEVQSFLQLHSGSNALDESKKAIDLSNSQIEESKRGKISTLEKQIHPRF